MSSLRIPCATCAAALLLVVPLRADVLRVPQDHASIQDAVDAAVEGDTVLVSKGTWPGNVVIAGRTGLTLRGKGKVVLEATGPGPVVSVVESSQIVVRGLRLTGAVGSDGIGVSVHDSSDVTVERCLSYDNDDDGFQAWHSDGVTISRCRSLADRDEGIELWGVTHARIDRNLVVDCGEWGMGLEAETDDPLDLVATRNRVVRPADGGIGVWGFDLHVERNRVVDPGWVGFSIEGGDSTLERNVVLRSHSDAFQAVESTGVVLERNRAVTAGVDGFDLDVVDGAFERNRSVHAGVMGFLVRAGGNSVTRNVAVKSGSYDLRDESGGGNVYDHNTFKTVDPGGQQP